jgi:hypothetical protein
MGADGWIDIYDAEKAEKEGLLDKIKALDIIQMYEREIFGKRILTIYSETERCIFDPRYPFDGYLTDMTGEEVNLFKNFYNLCYIDTWEVWT